MEEKKLNNKIESFNKDFSNHKIFEQNLEKIFQYIFSNIFPNILNLPRIDFINIITTTVKAILEEQYSSEIYSNEKFFSLFLSLNKKFEKKYGEYNQILSSSWDIYQNELYNSKKEEDINNYKLVGFRKHCGKTQEYAIHNCNQNERGKYIVVYDKTKKNEKMFVICEKCRKVYNLNLFINYCQHCNCNYYCGLLGPKEDPNLLQATYYSPHCESIANDKIPCTKCKKTFYYNIKENILKCINPSCKYQIKPTSGNFKCNICSTYFTSDIKIFNNFELLYIKKIVDFSLLIKEKAHPGILPCCKNLEENNIIFKHKKECKGDLFFWILNQKLIVICEKCKAINYYSRFIWTCPNCGLHFRAKKEEIEEKLKKNLFKNLKYNININILIGDEFLLDNNSKIGNNDNINNGFKILRRKSFRDILNMKKKEENVNEKNENKIEEQYKKINEEEKEKMININEENNDNYIYRTKSKNKLNEEEKPSMKKKKNYLFEKLLRNQFLPKNSKDKHLIQRTKSGVVFSAEQKNNDEENKILVSENKLIRLRERSGSNYYRNNIRINQALNNIILSDNGHKNKKDYKNEENENENKLNNSDDAEKVDETSFIMEFNKKNKKNNKCSGSNKNGLPPLPLKHKYSKVYNTCGNNVESNDNNNELNKDEKKEINKEKNKNQSKYIINKRFKMENDNNEGNKNEFNIEYKLEKHSDYKTPRIIRKKNSEADDKDFDIDKDINKDNCLNSNKNLVINSNFEMLNIQREKSGKIILNLEEKFNDNYTQKKTKNKTSSNEEEEKNDDKDKIERNEYINDNENENKNEVEKIENKEIISEKINNNNNNHNKENNKLRIHFRNRNGNKFKNIENKEIKELPILNLNQDNNLEKENSSKEIINGVRPDDIINSSMFDSKIDIPIDNSTIKNDEALYSSIQRQIKKILSKGKLPQFNIDNYKIEKQIGEGSFGIIFEVVNKKTQLKYAMKKIIANNLTSLETHQKEFEIVHQNSHPNILDILGICIRCLDQTTFVLYVLMDLALHDWDFEIEERKKTKKYYKESELISILKQICSALEFLQKEKNIAHRDIKPENILVFKNDVYKLGDFGEAKINKLLKNAKATIRGTEMYMSPLLFKSLQENQDDVTHDIFKSDVFSLGYCLIFAAALDFKVISEIRYINNDFKLRKILQRMFFVRYSNDFIEIILKMISIKEEDRVDFIGLKKLLENQHF